MEQVRPHQSECLMRRYMALSSAQREWFPYEDFSSREDMCSCGAIPQAQGNQPRHVEAVTDAREMVDTLAGNAR